MQNKTSVDRQIHYDMLRIVSVFFMMMLHVAAGFWSRVPIESDEWRWFNIYDSLARFCVPVFVMISGVFLLNSDKDIKLEVLYKKYILRIVVAFLIWSTLYASLFLVVNFIEGNGLNLKLFLTRIVTGNYHLWYLFMIVGVYLIIPFIKKIAANKHLMEYYLVLWFVFSIVMQTIQNIPMFSIIKAITHDMHLFFVLGYSGYFIMGYYLNTYKLKQNIEIIVYISVP